MKNPLAAIKDKFENKAKLVSELESFTKNEDLWVSRLNTNKGLAHVSNAKLLKLHATFTAVKEKFGTRAKMIDAIAELEKRAKDEGYKTRLGGYPVPRLWDMYKSLSKRTTAAAKSAETKAKAPKAAKPAEPKKTAAAAKPAAPKTAAKKTSAKK
jgi:hypothetical protein